MSDDVPPTPPPPETAVPREGMVFEESPREEQIPPEVLRKQIREFDLAMEGRPLERVVNRFLEELRSRGITHLKPRFYLTDEWGVPEGTVAIGIPFYLANDELRRVQEIKGGIVEGANEDEILRYLRHEMGHVLNYAYRLYEAEEWTRLFGPMSRPYPDDYRPQPLSPDFVRHLPGYYAQRHPDEDWAETFAVWMDPTQDWRDVYSDSPGALQKLEYCDATVQSLKDLDPGVTSTELDVEARDIALTVQEYYEQVDLGDFKIPHSLDGDLRRIVAPGAVAAAGDEKSALSNLLSHHRRALTEAVWTWTGVDPSVIAPVVDHLRDRARVLALAYRSADRTLVLQRITAFLTALAMNYVYKGSFTAK